MNTVLSIKTDKETKDEARKIAKAMGLTLSSLVNSYLKQVVLTRRIELYAPEPMTPKLEAMIATVEKEIKAGQVSTVFENADDFIADLERT